jgi:ketosteroid isomerase-like protein
MTATITQSTAITEVTAAVDIFMNYVNQGDLENMLAMYSEDSSVLPP